MRAEDLVKTKPVVYVHDNEIVTFGELDASNDVVFEHKAREQYSQAQTEVIARQKNQAQPTDGYIVFQDVVYKAFVNRTVVKITGEEAKSVKRRIKKAA